jgi:cyclopropane fatty-acyl-phospholipid synthase-like methyltransferase
MQNWLRLWFAGWGPKDFKVRPKSFLDERQKHGFKVYESVFRQARERLRPGGVMVLHLGASRKSDMAKELSTVASTWFQTRDIFAESVRHLESHGIRDKGTVTEHKYLVLD